MAITIRLGELVGGSVCYPDDPAFVDGDGDTFDDSFPRVDGGDAASEMRILKSAVRVKSWTYAVQSVIKHYVNKNYTTNPDGTATATGEVEYELDSTTTTDPLGGTLPADATSLTEQGVLAGIVGTLVLEGGQMYIYPGGVRRGDPGNPVDPSSTAPTTPTCAASLALFLLCNANASDGNFPLLLTFGLSGTVTVPCPTQPTVALTAQFTSGGDHTPTADYSTGLDHDNAGTTIDLTGNDGTDALTFLKDGSGADLTFNLTLPVGGAYFTYLAQPTPPYTPPTPPAGGYPPGYTPPGPYQPPPVATGYYVALVTSVKVKANAYFTFGGRFDGTTGATPSS